MTSTRWILCALAALLSLARLHTYDEPLERDITTYAVIGHELLAGRPLYSDLWDHKPPAVHVAYAAAELVAGYGPRAVYLLNVAASVATLLGVYAAAAWASSPAGGLLAAALWTVVSGDLRLQGNQPNTEVFVNACLAWGFVLLLRARSRTGVASAGALLALATLFKHVALAPIALVAAAWAFVPDREASRRRRALDVALLAGVGAAAWAAVFLYFAARGRFAPFYEAVFVFNRTLAGGLLKNLGDGLREVLAGRSPLLGVAPVAALAALGIPAALRTGARRSWLLVAPWIVGSAAAVWLPGKPTPEFFPHYYQLLVPPLVVAAGGAAAGLAPGMRNVAAALTLLLALSPQLPSYALPADEWSRRKYGETFLETKALAARLESELPADYDFYEWGNETGLYFYSKRSPPIGLFYVSPVFVRPSLLERVADPLARRPPHVVVVERTWPPPARVEDWLASNYALAARVPGAGGFELWTRR
jgi:hypothetical protein